MQNNKLVSIIIPTLNYDNNLTLCLDSLSKQEYFPVEVIVINNSMKSLEDFKIRFPQVAVKDNQENFGFARSNNQGIELARGDLILFLNDDVTVEKDFLVKLVNRMNSDERIGICQSKILLMQDKVFLDGAGSLFTFCGFLQHLGHREKDNHQYDGIREIFSPKGACMLIRKVVLNKIGGFDEDFFAFFEETDLAWRAWLAGRPVEFVYDSIIYHKVGATATKLPSDFIDFHSFKNRICALIKNLELRNLLLILPMHIFLCFLIAFFYLMKLKIRNFKAVIKAVYWNVINLNKTLTKRMHVQKDIRVFPDKEIFNRVATRVSFKYFLVFMLDYFKNRW